MAGVWAAGMLSGERVILWPVLDFSPIMVVDSLPAASDLAAIPWAESAAKSVKGSVYCSRCTVTLGLIRSFSLTALVDCAVLVDPTSTRIKLIIVE
jgi:hypothetical protein